MELQGKYGATASMQGGVKKHENGSFTMYAIIKPYNDLFKKTYMNYTIGGARKLFRKSLQDEVDKYFVSKE
jgi:hypothetical protein